MTREGATVCARGTPYAGHEGHVVRVGYFPERRISEERIVVGGGHGDVTPDAGAKGFTTIGEICAFVGSGDCELEECRSLEAGSIVAISGLVILCILLDSFR